MIIVICAGIAAGIFAGDLIVKNSVERRDFREKRELWGGRLLLRRYHNEGMAFGLGAAHRPAVAVLSVMMTMASALLLIFSLGQSRNRWLQVGLSLVAGGAFSNTYDRLKRRYVVDYVSFGVRWKPLRNLVFNISDFCIIIGALLAAFGAAR